MKVHYPLTLKISVWLLLNLLLLAAGAAIFLGAQGSFGLDALVRGPAGNRAQVLGQTMVNEFAEAADAAAAKRVLERYGDTYSAKFMVVHPTLKWTIDPRGDVPEDVAARIDEGGGSSASASVPPLSQAITRPRRLKALFAVAWLASRLGNF